MVSGTRCTSAGTTLATPAGSTHHRARGRCWAQPNKRAHCTSCPSPALAVAVGWPLPAHMSRDVVQEEGCMVPCSPNPQGDAGTGLSHPWHLLPGMVVLWGKSRVQGPRAAGGLVESG